MDKVPYFVLGLLLFLEQVLGNPRGFLKNHEGLIVGGYNISIEDVPYQAYLLVRIGALDYQCGGSIISSKAVLTAAHCLTGASVIRIRIGSTYANQGGSVYRTSLYVIHPQYDPITSDYDVAVIRVLQEMTLDGTTSRVINLPEQGEQVPVDTELLVTGWGRTQEGGSVSNNLMAVEVITVSYEDCQKAYDDLTERMICAGVPGGGKDSCQGDSGGPAKDISTEKQVGIVSYGIGCGRPDYPGVYTNVSYVTDWIKKVSGM